MGRPLVLCLAFGICGLAVLGYFSTGLDLKQYQCYRTIFQHADTSQDADHNEKSPASVIPTAASCNEAPVAAGAVRRYRKYKCDYVKKLENYASYLKSVKDAIANSDLEPIVNYSTLIAATEHILDSEIPGSFVGIVGLQSGASVMVKAVVQAHACFKKKGYALARWHFIANSFEGSEKTVSQQPAQLKAGRPNSGTVKKNAIVYLIRFVDRMLNLYDDTVQIINGHLSDTFPLMPGEQLIPISVLQTPSSKTKTESELLHSSIASSRGPKYRKYNCTEVLRHSNYSGYIAYARKAILDGGMSLSDYSWNWLIGAVEKILDHGIEGDFIETGVWRGGTSMIMKAVVQAHACFKTNGIALSRRHVFADSFEGFTQKPLSDEDKSSFGHWGGELESYNKDRDNPNENNWGYDLAYDIDFALNKLQLFDDSVKIVKGFFSDSLVHVKNYSFTVVRHDGDLYSSTNDVLETMYEQLIPGGWIVIDDWLWDAPKFPARKACLEYRKRNKISAPIWQLRFNYDDIDPTDLFIERLNGVSCNPSTKKKLKCGKLWNYGWQKW
eukprot:TRINITY_DN4174_c1_g2_i2.p1 TRINITY_DN4174_c1_g2~~TRINITY_DN4174_c1_g2_i2.p1  ORF type:complete len:555 (+),score=52.33 TRINITY_DN4174_c1_g2_i2:129-1793(+)